jgi:hypothetical protein
LSGQAISKQRDKEQEKQRINRQKGKIKFLEGKTTSIIQVVWTKLI